ncbi:hypothetical protein HDK77DRAFT_492721 [Phyllosticta capitalensis]
MPLTSKRKMALIFFPALLMLILSLLHTSSALFITPPEQSLGTRQITDQFDTYACYVCQPGTGESPDIGGDDCIELRDDESTCPDLTLTESLLGPAINHSILIEETQKKLTWTIDNVGYTIIFEPYPSCSDAARTPASKWYGFPSPDDPSQCPLQIKQLAQSDVETKTYQSDHIFEAQTLLQFFQWLRGDFEVVSWPGTYQRPSKIDFEQEPFEWSELSLWEHAIDELGGNGYPSRLALVDGSINRKKGTFFTGGRPSVFPSKDSRIGPVKKYQREVVGVFQYMSDETVWGIFTDTSKSLEDVFGSFDVAYDWVDDGVLGRPDREEGQPPAGLRDLFCWFMDALLHDIEERAITWALDTHALFDSDKLIENPDNPNEKEEWLGQFVNGILTADRFKFPQVDPEVDEDGVIQHSPYGLWDNGPIGPF